MSGEKRPYPRLTIAIDFLIAIAIVLGIELFRDRSQTLATPATPAMPVIEPVPTYAILQEADLQREVKSLACDGETIERAIDKLHDQTGLNIVVRWGSGDEPDQLKADTPVHVRLEDVPFGTAMRALLDSAKAPTWDFDLRDNVVEVASENKLTTTRIYDTDLLQHDPPQSQNPMSTSGSGGGAPGDRQENLMRLIEEIILPDVWKDEGGPVGSLNEWDGLLIVTQMPRGQREVAAFLEQLRTRGTRIGNMLPSTEPAPSFVILREVDLQREVKSLVCDGETIQHAIDMLHDQTGLNIVAMWHLDGFNLLHADTPVHVRLAHVPFSTAMRALLDAANAPHWDFRLHDNVVEVAPEAGLIDWRIYDVSDLIARDLPRLQKLMAAAGSGALVDPVAQEQDAVDAIIRIIEEKVSPDTWQDQGGVMGSLHEWDGLLVVGQTPKNQREVAALLDQMRSGVIEIPATLPSTVPNGQSN